MLGYFDLEPQLVLNELARRQGLSDWLKSQPSTLRRFVSIQEKPQATYEQAVAIDNARLGQSFKVIAYAGTGKTTTLQMISDAMPQRRGMYLAFNKAIAAEAQQNFTVMSTAVLFTRWLFVAYRVV